ncbi:hypothetical protein V7S43_014756 [Phytophthora oleae]|uniref:Uncharacterized protein n=1 Tax=Phytophthora oleae TaxID=2107226 RepID=A0ABD3F091_9STRA
MAPGAFARYLGIQAGPDVAADEVWNIAVKQLRTRLNLAMKKTLTVEQRAATAAAIILPKLLYIGRHAWPLPATVAWMERHIKNYVWHGAFGFEVTGTRAWLNGDVASLRITEGGLAIPNLRTELMAMAADVVPGWALRGDVIAHIVGAILFATALSGDAPGVYITPEARATLPT